ncbi:MAG: uroporphyrinogen decarboxylase [Pseudomonadota bacterium]
MANTAEKPLLSTLMEAVKTEPAIWMMRQAGRHLEEYLEVRSKAKDFLDFCYTPSLASEATLQPIRRYGMDGAILFADILLILDAMGRNVRFEPGIGPIVEKVSSGSDLKTVPPQTVAQRLGPIYETVSRVKSALPKETTLIGFAGSPWTVALYALEGRGKTDKSEARLWAHGKSDMLQELLSDIVEASAHYLKRQADAGADALMLFDSWAEGLPNDVFSDIIIEPTKALVARLRGLGVTCPIIGFPRGAAYMIGAYVEQTGVSAVGLDTAAVPDMVNDLLPKNFPVQGHLDPLLLLAGGERLDQRVRYLIEAYRDRPHIFNLGHGVLPATPVPHVERVVDLVRGRA